MIEAINCEIDDIYEEITTGQTLIVKAYDGIKVFEFCGQPGMYAVALNEKYHKKKS